ncbi:MAG: mechanosensitive ion channel family protein [Actinomycetota bacterium]|nr:mechanosensitive ion channel family protein [Actinomycetota bacterium]
MTNWSVFSDWGADAWNDQGGHVVATAFVLVGAWVVIRLLKRAIGRWETRIEGQLRTSEDQGDRERGQRLVTISDVVRVLVSVVVWTVVVLTVMGIWGIPMAPFVAVGATVGIAVGFGAQDVVRDVIAGFLILVEDQFAIGDVVTIAGVSGAVEGIRLRTTVLRDLEGNQHYVPNGQIKVASNLTSDFSRLVVDVPVSYDTNVDVAIAVISDEVDIFAKSDDWRHRFLGEPEMLGVNKLDESSVNIRVVMTLTTEDRWVVKREFLRRLKNRLDDEGIEIPYNYLTIVTRGDKP